MTDVKKLRDDLRARLHAQEKMEIGLQILEPGLISFMDHKWVIGTDIFFVTQRDHEEGTLRRRRDLFDAVVPNGSYWRDDSGRVADRVTFSGSHILRGDLDLYDERDPLHRVRRTKARLLSTIHGIKDVESEYQPWVLDEKTVQFMGHKFRIPDIVAKGTIDPVRTDGVEGVLVDYYDFERALWTYRRYPHMMFIYEFDLVE